MYNFGYVAVVGKPNAGKSTLVNSLVGEKVAIVSEKPQTTRDNILGILNGQHYQVVLVDTPGVHHTKNKLDKYMMKNVRSAIAGVDLILYLFDGSKPMDSEELEYIAKLRAGEVPIILLQTKADKQQRHFDGLQADFCISATTGKNLQPLKEAIIQACPSSEEPNFLFARDEYTDKSVKYLVAEQIREEALRLYHQELPHGIAIEVTKFVEKDDLIVIEADIICEADRHKGMIIGKGGANLKKIGQNARAFAEDLLGKKVLLKLFVKVEPNWRDNPKELRNLGFE